MSGEGYLKPPKIDERLTWVAAVLVASQHYGVPAQVIQDCRGRSTRAAGRVLEARRAAIYLASTGGNLGVLALGRATGMTCPTLRYHLAIVEDDREFAERLDALMDQLTAMVQSSLARLGDRLAPAPALPPPHRVAA